MTWQPIETAPRDGRWVLGYWPACSFEGRIIPMKWYDSSYLDGPYWLDAADSRDFTQPTHWMTLPNPPQEA
jgi:hypothetical protein